MYADNPTHYIYYNSPLELPEIGGRYPPVVSAYYNHGTRLTLCEQGAY